MAATWYIGKNGKQSGPFTGTQVREMAAVGDLTPTDLVWKEGMADWVAAGTLKGLFDAGAPSVAPPPPHRNFAPPTGIDIPLTFDTTRQAGPLHYADYLPRVGASLLDGLFTGLMGCVPWFVLVFLAMVMAGDNPDTREGLSVVANCVSQLVSFVIGITYYVVLETSSKQGTWGKQIVGIKVADIHGNRLTTGRAIGRYVAKMVNVFTCGIGVLMPLFTERKQTLHDMIAGCVALKAES